MKRFVEGDDRSQVTLLPECLDDYVDQDNPVRVVEAFVEQLDLRQMGFDGVAPAATGRPAYHPAMLLKLYIYGYLNRVQSSRRLEREAQRHLVAAEIRVLAVNPGKNTGIVTILFTDIEGSTLLWEQDSERMRFALARHDEVLRSAVESNRGTVVKMLGDGMHAAFDDPLDAVSAALQLQQALADEAPSVALWVRCGLHLGVVERRDGDLFGSVVNRAARIMDMAHGGQVLLSQPVAGLVRDRLPPSASLRDLGKVRLRDFAIPEQVYQLQHPSLRPEFPALRTLEETPNNLSRQVTSFVGREDERAEVLRLLAKHRLVTLIGPGGVGKTRLSLQVGVECLSAYPDGIWFVDLAPLSEAPLVGCNS